MEPADQEAPARTQAPAPAPPPVALDAWLRRWSADVPLAGLLADAADVLVVSAHPDDETLGAGRLVASASGGRRAVVLTAGERCYRHPRLDPRALAARRLGEWREAVRRLGAEPVDLPRWPDGELTDAVAAIAAALAPLVDRNTLVVAPWRDDPHPDHRAAGLAAASATATAAARLVEYPVWAPYWLAPGQVAALGVRLAPVTTDAAAHAAWLAALGVRLAPVTTDAAAHAAWLDARACYPSQTRPLFDGWPPVVPADLADHHPAQLVAVRDAHA